jgi:hypothetical protein
MNLLQSNPHLRSAAKREKLLFEFAKDSSAIEGIRHPFTKGNQADWPQTMDDIVNYWKKRVAESARSRKRRDARAEHSRDPSRPG